MADKLDKSAPTITENIPSKAGHTSALGSAAAPYIFFDEVRCWGFYSGVGHITLEALRFMPQSGADLIQPDLVVTAHLRFNGVALKQLKKAIEQIEAMAEAPPSTSAN